MAQDVSSRSELVAELEADRDAAFRGGRSNNITDIVLSTLTVFASLAATVLVATHCPIAIAASMAAVPAACTSLQRIVNFRARSHWYFEQSSELSALAVSLRYAKTPDLEEYAGRRAGLGISGDKRWSQIGLSGITASTERKKP